MREADGKANPARDDDRITPVGRLSERHELMSSQLINILKGDMSIVGPRPERVKHMENTPRLYSSSTTVLKGKGGLTGYAQVYGKYNTTPLDKLKMDLML